MEERKEEEIEKIAKKVELEEEVSRLYPMSNIRSILSFLLECVTTGKYFSTEDITDELVGREIRDSKKAKEDEVLAEIEEYSSWMLYYEDSYKSLLDIPHNEKTVNNPNIKKGYIADQIVRKKVQEERKREKRKQTGRAETEEDRQKWNQILEKWENNQKTWEPEIKNRQNARQSYNMDIKRNFIEKIKAYGREIEGIEKEIYRNVLQYALEASLYDPVIDVRWDKEKGWVYDLERQEIKDRDGKLTPDVSTDLCIGGFNEYLTKTIREEKWDIQDVAEKILNADSMEGKKDVTESFLEERKKSAAVADFEARITENLNMEPESEKRLFKRIYDENGKETIHPARESRKKNRKTLLSVFEVLLAEVMLLSDDIYRFRFPVSLYDDIDLDWEDGEEDTGKFDIPKRAFSYRELLDSDFFMELLYNEIYHAVFIVFENVRYALKERTDREKEGNDLDDSKELMAALDILQYRIFPAARVLLGEDTEDIKNILSERSEIRRFCEMMKYIALYHDKLDADYKEAVIRIFRDDYNKERLINNLLNFFSEMPYTQAFQKRSLQI